MKREEVMAVAREEATVAATFGELAGAANDGG